MNGILRWTLGLTIAAMLTLAPFFYYRAAYSKDKRFREVEPGVLYRSGQLTAEGFSERIREKGIRTVINAQDEYPDPELSWSYWGGKKIRESELCRQLGVRYIHLPPDLLKGRRGEYDRPEAIDEFLEIMDNKENHPVLVHCKAGLHRTGCLAAVFRLETPREKECPWYSGWTPRQAIEELKANGFGEYPCSISNAYIDQYILSYKPGIRIVREPVEPPQP